MKSKIYKLSTLLKIDVNEKYKPWNRLNVKHLLERKQQLISEEWNTIKGRWEFLQDNDQKLYSLVLDRPINYKWEIRYCCEDCGKFFKKLGCYENHQIKKCRIT